MGRGALSSPKGLFGILGLLVLVLVIALLANGGADGKHSDWSFGAFAGYVWRGRVTSIQASWTVPRVLQGSLPSSIAATWIGAQTEGKHGPFIQIGVNQLELPPSRVAHREPRYYAFWSDVKHSFHPQFIFVVKPEDVLSASLDLTHGHWVLAIRDHSTSASSRFSTADEAHASFNLAEWTQEDVTSQATKKVAPYPRLTTVGFRGLAVNSTPPAYGDLYSTWMSANGVYWAPTPLRGDSFTLRKATVTPAGSQYLSIANSEDLATLTFTHGLSDWTTKTSRSQITAARSAFSAALAENMRALAAAGFPPRARNATNSLIKAAQVVAEHTRSPVPSSEPGINSWRLTWQRYALAIGNTAHVLKRVLGLPEIRPVP